MTPLVCHYVDAIAETRAVVRRTIWRNECSVRALPATHGPGERVGVHFERGTLQVPRVIASDILHRRVQLTRRGHECVDLSIASGALALAVDPRFGAVVRHVATERVVHAREVINHCTAVCVHEHVMHVQVFNADSGHVVSHVIGACLALREACAVHHELDLTRLVCPN